MLSIQCTVDILMGIQHTCSLPYLLQKMQIHVQWTIYSQIYWLAAFFNSVSQQPKQATFTVSVFSREAPMSLVGQFLVFVLLCLAACLSLRHPKIYLQKNPKQPFYELNRFPLGARDVRAENRRQKLKHSWLFS